MSERLERVESQVAEVWAMLRENQQQMSELKSSIATLANVAGIHDGQIERVEGQMERVEGQIERVEGQIERLGSQIERVEGQTERVGGQIERLGSQIERVEGQMEQLLQTQQESRRLHDELAQRSDRDRALMLQLIQNLAQGRNGGEGN
jgi:chromosome segregation ATPase